MTDNFLQKLEEKVMVLLTELESLRKEINQLRHENANLRTERANHAKKLQGLVSLLDSLEAESANYSNELRVVGAEEEFATA
jgi:regulator of replication initiation timing